MGGAQGKEVEVWRGEQALMASLKYFFFSIGNKRKTMRCEVKKQHSLQRMRAMQRTGGSGYWRVAAGVHGVTACAADWETAYRRPCGGGGCWQWWVRGFPHNLLTRLGYDQL